MVGVDYRPGRSRRGRLGGRDRLVQADGQYTLVVFGDAAQILELSSREGGAPPKLVLTIQD